MHPLGQHRLVPLAAEPPHADWQPFPKFRRRPPEAQRTGKTEPRKRAVIPTPQPSFQPPNRHSIPPTVITAQAGIYGLYPHYRSGGLQLLYHLPVWNIHFQKHLPYLPIAMCGVKRFHIFLGVQCNLRKAQRARPMLQKG